MLDDTGFKVCSPSSWPCRGPCRGPAMPCHCDPAKEVKSKPVKIWKLISKGGPRAEGHEEGPIATCSCRTPKLVRDDSGMESVLAALRLEQAKAVLLILTRSLEFQNTSGTLCMNSLI